MNELAVEHSGNDAWNSDTDTLHGGTPIPKRLAKEAFSVPLHVKSRVRVLGSDDRETLATRNNIAAWTGRRVVPEAFRFFQELLPDVERVLDREDPDTLRTRSNIAAWTGETGNARDLAHLGHEAVSPSGDSFYIFLPGGRFSKGLAQCRDVVGKVALLQNCVWPNAMDQLIFVDEVATRFNEYAKVSKIFARRVIGCPARDNRRSPTRKFGRAAGI